MSRRVLVNLITFLVVFAVMLWWAVNNIVTFDFLERPYEIQGRFAQSAGVATDSEVAYLGVHFGRVGAVEREPEGGVLVTMKIDRDKHIPAGSTAHIFRKSAVGEPYIDFAPPADFGPSSTDVIEAGDVIALEDTTTPLEFSELLRSASALLSGIDPDAAGSLVHELAAALHGRSGSLRALTESIDQLTGSFAERTEQLDRLADNSTRVTKAVADHRGSLSRSIGNLRAVAETLRDADGDLRAVLADTPDFLGVTADLVSDQKANLDCLLSDLEAVVRASAQPERIRDLETLLDVGPTAFGYVANSIDRERDGPWIRVNLLVTTEGPARVYDPRPSLPAVPAIPACDSTLTPASAAPFDPAALAPAGPPVQQLPATGDRPLAVLALFLAAGAIATWRLRRPAVPSPDA